MGEKPTKDGSGIGPVLVAAVILVALPMLYVLSIGPMAWLDSKGLLSESAHPVLEYFYFPLALAANSEVPILGPAIQSYVEWCGG
jgi:hypothetical protein